MMLIVYLSESVLV